MKAWKRLSIAKKLYIVIGTMALLIAGELATLNFAMGVLSGVRAFVGGEGLWSNAQKNAVFRLQRFGVTRNEDDYAAFLSNLKIPDGDHQARIELEKPHPDLNIVRAGFIQGRIHPDDVDRMITLIQNFAWESHLANAIEAWRKADQILVELKKKGIRYHELLGKPNSKKQEIDIIQTQILEQNQELTALEENFSKILGTGSRWLEYMVISFLFIAVLMVESVGLTLTFLTSRSLTRDLAEINSAATRIGRGDFNSPLKANSADEIGGLADAIEKMRQLLDQSYKSLESRVESRTSELKFMAQENEKLYRQAQAAVEMRDEFISIATHELKTPLTSIFLQLQMLSRKIITTDLNAERKKLKDYIEAGVRMGARVNKLVDELMDLTRIRAGKFEIKTQSLDLAGLTIDTIAELSSEAAKKGNAINIEVPNPVIGNFDSVRVSQVITNLLSNAIKYGNGKPIEIRVGELQGKAFVEVKDHGLGISKAMQAKIFDRFERGASEEIGGLGLGLFITRKIILAHQGEISVKSVTGQGSTFRIEIPVNLPLSKVEDRSQAV